ncbi:farnesyl-diphosphate farnesyltransferase [Paenibacillus methanolicus]|uniref:Farnesyl-diphosphate farnesyltransferase n=2 Tax=Paenibacillus methanolicus TaxID=582686 RepID=A0A5S5CLR6_9BACL|nr:farnesyl-diphosphate farnesyltransferase [Paenibacillus methanolicus]
MIHQDAMTMLKKTSRTFFIPISRLEGQLQEAVASGYLCMRAIDEIEDHTDLDDELKIKLLQDVRDSFRSDEPLARARDVLAPYKHDLPEVSWQLHEWAGLCPSDIAPTVYRYTAKMSDEMAYWVDKKWIIDTEEDLDRYTYSVAGMVGEMLSELWLWNDGTQSDRGRAVAFGRGLQAVNILRNKAEDGTRGVSFFPKGWGMDEMLAYTRRNLKEADAYLAELKEGQAKAFCKIPLALAHATVKLISGGGNKLTRDAVLKIVNKLSG